MRLTSTATIVAREPMGRKRTNNGQSGGGRRQSVSQGRLAVKRRRGRDVEVGGTEARTSRVMGKRQRVSMATPRRAPRFTIVVIVHRIGVAPMYRAITG